MSLWRAKCIWRYFSVEYFLWHIVQENILSVELPVFDIVTDSATKDDVDVIISDEVLGERRWLWLEWWGNSDGEEHVVDNDGTDDDDRGKLSRSDEREEFENKWVDDDDDDEEEAADVDREISAEAILC